MVKIVLLAPSQRAVPCALTSARLAGLLGAETGSLDTMLDNVRQIEESTDPAHMDVQGAAVFSMGGTPSVLGEGASVRDMALDANEQQARVRQEGEEEVRKWRQQKPRQLGAGAEARGPQGAFFAPPARRP